MSYRFITKSIHAYVIDYPFAIVLIAAPFVLKLGQSGPVAMWLSVVVGIAALLLPALTDHPTGLVRIIPYWLHLWVDRAVREIGVGTPRRFTGAKPRDGGQRCDIWSLRAARHRSCRHARSRGVSCEMAGASVARSKANASFPFAAQSARACSP